MMPPGVIPTEFAPVLPPGFGPFVSQQVQVWQGQFPPPEAIERYVAVQPDSFDRIIKMAERQQESAIDAAAKVQGYQHRDTKRGQYLGFAVTFAAVIGAAYCGMTDHVVVAVALVSIPVMTVARALIDSGTVRKQVEIAANATAASSAEEHG